MQGFESVSERDGGGYGPTGNSMPFSLQDNQAIYGIVPSFDFSLFQLPNFGELFANEFGASTRFNANTPTGYADYSINQLLGLLQPQPYPSGLFTPYAFQDPSGGRQTSQQSDRALSEYGKRTQEAIERALERERQENQSISLRGILGLPPLPKDTPVLCNDCSPEQEEELKKTGTVTGASAGSGLFSSILGGKVTKEMGYLFMGVIILILLLLFVRK